MSDSTEQPSTIDDRIRQAIADSGLRPSHEPLFSGNVRIENAHLKANWFWGSKPISRLTIWRINRYFKRSARHGDFL